MIKFTNVGQFLVAYGIGRTNATMATVNLNGANYYYELHGQGQPIIFISGFASNHSQWLRILDNFVTSGYQVLLFDNRGTGKTTDDGCNLTIELMAHDIIALIKSLNLVKPHIIGSSMGGTIAQSIAINYGNEINKLVLICTTGKWRQASLLGLQSLLKLQQQKVEPMTVIQASFARLFGEKFLSNKKAIDELTTMILDDPSPTTLNDQLRQFSAMQHTDNRGKIAAIANPTLIIRGREDSLSLSYESEELVQNIRNSKLIEFDCGHVPLLEATTELVNSLTKFFN